MAAERGGEAVAAAPKPFSAASRRSARLWAVVRPPERLPTALATLSLTLVMTGHACIETARDALFLTHAPVTNLPWVYLVLAVLAILVSHLVENRSGRETVWRGLVATQLFAAFGTLAFVMRVPIGTYWTFHALYVWGGLASTVVLVRFWMLLSERMTASQAKRLFPLIAAGPVAGTLIGFGIASVAGRELGGHGLLLLSSCLLFASAAVGLLLRDAFCNGEAAAPAALPGRVAASHRALEQAHKIRGTSGFRLILKNRYVRRMTLVMLAASICATLGDFLFKMTATRHVDVDDLSSFFAISYFVFNLLSVLVVLVVTPFIRWIGVPSALAVEPALLILGVVTWALFGGYLPLLYLRGVDGALRWSLQKTATELLYVPMSARLRTTVKALSDVLGHRGGQALASIVILAVLASRAPEWALGLALVIAAVVWIRAAASLRGPYLELFRNTLRSEFAATRLDFPDLDLESLEALIAALNSGD
ncbi:MAG TPA: Npt1/Npt2 family nucleotide transporter, partial [Terriglobales bacterium]|nr:Npt1/Npt2 family nucleotide transporter [Terriglobales bacterium]